MSHRTTFAWLLLAWCLIALGSASAGTNAMLIDVQAEPSAWYDSHLADKLEVVFSRNVDLRVTIATNIDAQGGPATPATRTHPDSLMNWGMEMGSRYLLTITINRSGLERRKTFNIPLLFHRYKTVGFIEGEIRFLDLAKGRMLVAEEFAIERSARDQFQAEGDDNRHDPALHLSSPEKLAFFSSLEDELTHQIVERVREHTKGR